MTTNIYLVCGDDEYLVTVKAREIVDSLVPEQERALGLEIVDGAATTVQEAQDALSECLAALLTPGFFDSRKVVWMRNTSFLSDSGPGKSEDVKQRVAELVGLIKKGLSGNQSLVISAGKVDKRYALWKACRAGGETFEFSVPDKAYLAEQQAAERLREIIDQADLAMTPEARSLFLEKVGTDTRRMVNEVEKLGLFAGHECVGIEHVAAVTTASREAVFWDLADAFGRRELGRSLALVRQLLFQNESAIGLLMGIGSRVKDLLLYHEALQRGWLRTSSGGRGNSCEWGEVPPAAEKIFSETFARDPRKTHPYRASLLAAQARGFTIGELRACRDALMDAHLRLVSTSQPHEVVLEVMLVRMLGLQEARTTGASVGR